MSPGDDWSGLADAWRAQPVDVARLKQASLWRGRRMKLLMALDVAGLLVVLALVLRLGLAGSGIWAQLGLGLGVAGLVASVAINYRLRRGLWQAANDSAVTLLQLQRDRCRNAIRMVQWGLLFLPLGLLVGLLLRDTPVSAMALQGAAWPPLLRLAAIVALLLAAIVASLLYMRRQRRKLAAIEALLQQLTAAD